MNKGLFFSKSSYLLGNQRTTVSTAPEAQSFENNILQDTEENFHSLPQPVHSVYRVKRSKAEMHQERLIKIQSE